MPAIMSRVNLASALNVSALRTDVAGEGPHDPRRALRRLAPVGSVGRGREFAIQRVLAVVRHVPQRAGPGVAAPSAPRRFWLGPRPGPSIVTP